MGDPAPLVLLHAWFQLERKSGKATTFGVSRAVSLVFSETRATQQTRRVHSTGMAMSVASFATRARTVSPLSGLLPFVITAAEGGDGMYEVENERVQLVVVTFSPGESRLFGLRLPHRKKQHQVQQQQPHTLPCAFIFFFVSSQCNLQHFQRACGTSRLWHNNARPCTRRLGVTALSPLLYIWRGRQPSVRPRPMR